MQKKKKNFVAIKYRLIILQTIFLVYTQLQSNLVIWPKFSLYLLNNIGFLINGSLFGRFAFGQ